ncbi:MAG TPA: glycosyltransferase [Geopsychrobacteraceae bacterium]|nr:glycosyltransferase [Geopsychrobacteraceae bacterium]
MTSLPIHLSNYLRKRAVSGPWNLDGPATGNFDACIVIPALNEHDSLPETLKSLSRNLNTFLSRTLIIIVVNNRADAATSAKDGNAKTLTLLNLGLEDNLQLAWADASSHGLELPSGQGVGLARKIGFDLALTRLNWAGKPFLVSLDADTLVDPCYLSALFEHFNKCTQGGAVIPFRHCTTETHAYEQAIRRYELYLRSYCYGLKLAGSPYAYTSIGSAFACTADAYIQAGGMNRRLAGEDFYFLQQLCKTSGVAEVQGALVYPSPRKSDRVPFGTGRALALQVDSGITPYTFCNKSSFMLLKNWLEMIKRKWQSSPSDIVQYSHDIDVRLYSFLKKLNFSNNWKLLQSNHSEQRQFLRSFHCWFDGLRTRQLLSALTPPRGVSDVELVNELLSWGGIAHQKGAAEQLLALEILQGVDRNCC